MKQKTSKLAIATLILSIIAGLPPTFWILSALIQRNILGFEALEWMFLTITLSPVIGVIALAFSIFSMDKIKKNNFRGKLLLKISWAILIFLLLSLIFIAIVF